MAREQVEAPRLHRLLAVGAVAFLAASSALAFARVFTAWDVPYRLVLVAVLSVGLAAALERRGLFLATVASGAALFVAVGVLIFPDTTFFGIPTTHTLGAILEATREIGEQAATEVAPTVPLRPLMLGSVTAVWTAAFSAHALAVRSGSPFLAALPPAALVAFAGMVMEDGPRPGYALLFLLGVLGVLFADGLQRVRQWGPLRPWTGSSGVRRRLVTATTTRGARRVAAVVAGVAVILPGLLPGFRAEPLLEIDTSPSGVSSVNPLVSVAASLRQDQPVELFTVSSSPNLAAYWRIIALDRFDGTTWDTDDMTARAGEEIQEGPLSLYPSRAQPTYLDQEFTITGLNLRGTPWLPMAFEPRRVNLSGVAARYDPDVTALVTSAGSPGYTYRVTSALFSPDPVQLDVPIDYDGAEFARYTELPGDIPATVFEIARQLTLGEPTPFRKALAIQKFLQTFTYDETVSYSSDATAMVEFLTETRRGFCQQFAGTMAVLLRALGIPARVAVGFTPGRYSPEDGRYHVTSENAHSWVEVLFPGFGWLAFEPTPGRTNPVALPYHRLPGPAQPDPIWCARQGCPKGAAEQLLGGGRIDTPGGRERQRDAVELVSERDTPDFRLPPELLGVPETEPGPSRMWLLAVAVAALLGALLVLVPLGKAGWRRLRLRRAGAPREVVLAAYDAFSSRAADLGLGRRAGETLWEHRCRLREAVSFSDGHLERLTGITGRAAYSDRSIAEDLAGEAVHAARLALRDMRRATPLRRRLVGLYRLGR